MIAVGSDHAGFELKQKIIEYLELIGEEFKDFGTYTAESVDYPVYASKVCNAVQTGECKFGILVCGTGVGMSMTANKYKGIRAAVCSDTYSAKMTRLHNDANILAIGSRVVGEGLALDIVKIFLETPFEGGRHSERVKIIDSL